jgi:CTP synthase (UTP-ammonia lyase)
MKIHPIDNSRVSNPHIREFLENFRQFKIKGIQHSVKVTKHNVIADRIIVGINKGNIYANDIFKIVKKYNFPEHLLKRLGEEWAQAYMVGLSLEADGDKLRYKVYVDKGAKNASRSTHKSDALFAVKWNPKSPLEYVVAKYSLLKKVTEEAIKSEVKKSGFDLYPDFIPKSIERKKLTLLYTTEDENSKRKSFDIRFNDIYLDDLTKDVLDLTNVDLYDKLRHLRLFPIRNFSGGVSDSGEKFFNLYFMVYENNELQTYRM